MIVISFVLVIVAAIALIVGLFQDSLQWIWGSIASCLLALLFLGIGVLQRRGAPQGVDEVDEYPGEPVGTLAGLRREPESTRDKTEDIAVVPKRTAEDARDVIASREATGTAAAPISRGRPSEDDESEIVPKKAAKKSAKKSTKKAAKKSAKKAAKKTTGATAKRRLAEVKGLGETKADALLKQFGSLEAIRDASVDDLTKVKGVGASTAEEIRRAL